MGTFIIQSAHHSIDIGHAQHTRDGGTAVNSFASPNFGNSPLTQILTN